MINKIKPKLDSILNNKPFFILTKVFLCLCTAIAGGAYNFYLQKKYYPSAEQIIGVLQFLTKDTPLTIFGLNSLYNIWARIGYFCFGLTPNAVRLNFTGMYFTALLLLSIIILRRAKTYFHAIISTLMIIFFSVLLHPVGGTSEFGIISPMIVNLLYNDHLPPLVFGMLSYLLLDIYTDSTNKYIKRLIILLQVLTFIYMARRFDLIYMTMFVVPLITVFVTESIKDRRSRGRTLICLSILLMFICMTRFIPSIRQSFFWATEEAAVYGSAFHGATSWMRIGDTFNHLSNYISSLLLYFNIDFGLHPLVAGYSVIFAIRLSLLLFGICVAIKIFIKSLMGTTDTDRYNKTDIVLSWSFVLQSLLYIFTTYADYEQFRYFWNVVFLITIIICRECYYSIQKIAKSSDIQYAVEKYSLAICIILFTLNLCYAGAGAETYEEDYEDELIEVCEYFKENAEPTNDNTVVGLAAYWFAPRLSMETGLVFTSYNMDSCYNPKNNSNIKYIVTNPDPSDAPGDVLRIGGRLSDEDIREIYGEPNKVVKFHYINVYFYN